MDDLELGVSRVPWEGGDVPDVLEAGDHLHESFKAEAKPGVGHGAVLAELPVPPEVLGQAGPLGRHGALQMPQALLPRRPANQLADARHQQIHR
eukprot:CAMPEP_0198450436 /NCGR_PEP_ID=MMETSP1453-20131121/5049_1 /TAXON_ID=1461543 ORGANISM="Unidentified sp., Strain RCC701" /NCGR_SAMPLE_ID=MMETSP1453 /ASSEMBLY_ACC=CAM_ASM_001118 /LENGTH=93 /DNA_ID=CAMNT_0044173497 /DNA_START=84 /DNA_END=362 /DNA_ORIENTATION=+